MKNKKPECYIIYESSTSEYGITKITPLGVYLDHSQAIEELKHLRKQEADWKKRLKELLLKNDADYPSDKIIAKITDYKFKNVQSYINFDGYSLKACPLNSITSQELAKDDNQTYDDKDN